MFRGTFATTIDPKGRTSIPARLRETLVERFADERFFITKCPVNTAGEETSRGLVLYPYNELLALEEKVASGVPGLTAAQLNSLRRLVLAPAVECTADAHGRVLIPPTLRAYAGLERDIVFVGVQRKVEIWSSERWDSVCAQAEKDFPTDTPALAELGF